MNTYPGQDMAHHDQGHQGYNSPPNPVPHQAHTDSPSANATSLDDLVSNAAKEADEKAAKAEKPREEKAGKKEKEKGKPTRLIYSDNQISPEEKMAKLSRYAFVPDTGKETVLGEAANAMVAGVVS
jgi:septal ring factor EnvC (AmiA/AmiB activator)